MKVWQCTVCKYIHRGENPPEKCPVCGVDSSKFIEIDEADIPEKTPRRRQPDKKTPLTSQIKIPIQKPKKEAGYEHVLSLLIKHHAHPVSVHTPNGLLPVAVILFVLAWMFDSQLFANAAIINLIFVICSLPFVIFTGILEWKKKYNGALTTLFKIKIFAVATTSISCTISLIWYLFDTDILASPIAWSFITINIIMLTAVGIAGHIGGKLVFKD